MNKHALLVLSICLIVTGTLRAASKPAIDFNRDVRPILSENCFSCHGPDKNKRKAGLRLDVKEDAFKKLDSDNFAIVPGKPAQSVMLKVISLPADDDDHMPPTKTGKRWSAPMSTPIIAPPRPPAISSSPSASRWRVR